MHKGINTTCDEGQTPIVVHGTQDPDISEVAHPLGRNTGQENALAFAQNQRDQMRLMDKAGALAAEPGAKQQTYLLHGTDKTVKVVSETDVAATMRARAPGAVDNSTTTIAQTDMAVRRLTPLECERLQGFPDGYTDVDWLECCGLVIPESAGKYGCPNCNGDQVARRKTSSDSGRYKALGNSMAVPVMRWIGERIKVFSSLD